VTTTSLMSLIKTLSRALISIYVVNVRINKNLPF